MAVAKTVYNTLFKRNSVYVGSIFFGAFAFGIGYDLATTAWWNAHNRGKQWADIRSKYLQDDSE
ncbi:putative QCR9-ubiquinol--cytochrome-c reductase subunit 9 [Testicularia cyperi]|uniref:Complex III subunit 9 n=1 Tax=Testicularia cyperi TaxID=1882483 RepID=A0A317XI62_9BASI|nr:putative QCR9-ubiquinol--cytochrome-c reductase subunit 9 [Testicularia cyperi]